MSYLCELVNLAELFFYHSDYATSLNQSFKITIQSLKQRLRPDILMRRAGTNWVLA